MSHFIEHSSSGQKIYDAMLLDASHVGVLGSDVAMSIISALSEENQCPMDVARKLKINEQKVYYYMRSLEKSGIVKKVGEEPRYGMTAKIYSVVSPVVAIKLHEKARTVQATEAKDPNTIEFLEPFIQNGRLNCKIIIGDPYPHGAYDEGSTDGVYTIELGLFLGRFLGESIDVSYKLDTEVTEDDLKDNLILIGNRRHNIVIDRLNNSLPAHFDGNGFVISKVSGKIYKDARNGVIMKAHNPLCNGKEILVIGGVRGRGTRSAIINIARHIETIQGMKTGHARIIEGMDKDGDRIIDSIKNIE